MAKLSDATLDKVHRLFPSSDWVEVVSLLENECTDNLPFYKEITDPTRYERVQFAVLKVSEGSLPRLRHVVDRAKQDWRGVLMRAGFGDLLAHTQWTLD